MDVKKLAGFLVLAFAVFYVITQPVASANVVRSAGGVVVAAANSMSMFVTSLF